MLLTSVSHSALLVAGHFNECLPRHFVHDDFEQDVHALVMGGIPRKILRVTAILALENASSKRPCNDSETQSDTQLKLSRASQPTVVGNLAKLKKR
jgi:hypothetical protein